MPFDSGSRHQQGLTEVGPESIMRGEPDVIRCRDNPIRDHPALQTAHPVGQHHLRRTTEQGEALRQHPQRRRHLLVSSEPHEPPPAPRQDGDEDVHAADDAPVDDQMLTR